MNVVEKNSVIAYLKKRNIVSPYLKAKKQLVQGNFKAVNLKKRQPYSENLWYFRITGKYRAIAERVGNKLYVFHISDHQ